jgi:hypothetical protein
MLITLLLASGMIAAPSGVAQIDAAAITCPSPEIMMGSHETGPKRPPSRADSRLVPGTQPEGKSPAVLLPECRVEPQKRRKRKSDYPMA